MMNYQFIAEVFQLIEKFDTNVDSKSYSKDLTGFKRWIYDNEKSIESIDEEPNWEGKENGRSSESVINTLIVHMNRYAKTYSRSAIYNSDFSTQEDFIYLINLKAFGAMTKMELIRKNIQEKPAGMQIINRLINQGWIQQSDSLEDKRSKIILITPKGIEALEKSMAKIRQATHIVTGNLSQNEKLELIKLLQKLEHFHEPIYYKNLDISQLVDIAYSQLSN
ncbi:MarR family winged helix-turn-helix transcriptional regulator [Pedobacter sp. ASV1-7]|uniref:MarR family winged helix-turn-helix transcriptional regulator n=1 Tax=Pedobacter sp. ASV1-7 TaxID=3145237 RepID=UPI0032E87014